jgi:hypothetical protein
MDRAYRDRPCVGSGRDSLSPAHPDVAAATSIFIPRRDRAISTDALCRATTDGQSRSVTARCETMRTGAAILSGKFATGS